MPNPKGKSIYHLCTDTEYMKKFNEKYPKLMSRFLSNSIKMAVENRSYFEKVYFNDIKIKEIN